MNRDSRDVSLWAIAAMVCGALAVHVAMAVALGRGYAIPTTIAGVIGGAVVLNGPVGKALARRLQGPTPSELPPDQVLSELDDLRGRLTELEERADFSERLLAKQRERDG